ncbi:bifunctional nuclease family protein [Gracilinema caldarium]|uniref:BFN domain-containing protein n=1 Tax=Gracilinema caldarium (strain ATCC 51460 / DSM 7334 / H1) TaxID=744872 RepID=F8F170_GRAC1|nr:bifunctional nuclease family protein [Gracilinema caldarium]AEJ20860.1 hypothetical protein Spica_2764 [Gracilinema caldarium DSM 7334]
MMKQHKQAHIIAILYDETQDRPFVLLQVDEISSYISIPIDAFEASSLIMTSESLVTPHPMIHDALAQFLNKHAFKARYVELWGSPLSGYFGCFRYRRLFFQYHLALGPADCLILALRLHLPIYIDISMVSTAQKSIPLHLSNDSGNVQILYLDAHQQFQTFF